jgi:microcystin-dependent protein
MLRTIVVLLFLFCSIYSQAQVGINNSNPDANSILDLNSTNKGLLIPRMLTAQRESMVSLKPAQGMMVYDTQLDVIFIFYSNKWYALNPWKTDYRTYNDSSASSMTAMFGGSTNYGNIGIGVDIPTEKFQVNGKIKATEFIGNGATPLGGIILWSGTIAPTGWALCDGDTANGYTTPNLKNRFVVGYNPSDWRYDWPGNLSQKGTSASSDIGGAATVALNLSQMPRHNHGVTDPKHKHQTTVTSVFGQGCTDNDDCERHFYNSRTTVFKYSSSVKTGVTIKDAGDDAAHENRPPYYTLAYIMRVY